MTTQEPARPAFDNSIWQGGNPSVSFDGPPPISFTGTVTDKFDGVQTDIKTREVLKWKSGDPKRLTVITLVSDDGELRDLYVKVPGNLFRAFKAAFQLQGVQGVNYGDLVTVTYTGDGVGEPGLTPPKLYSVVLAPGAGKIPPDPFATDDTAEG